MCCGPRCIRGAKAGWRSRVQQLRVAADPLGPMASRRFSLAAAGSATGRWHSSLLDLEGEALEALIQKRRQAEGAVLRPEPVRLADAEAVLSRWPVPVSFAGDRACYLPVPDRIQLPDRTAFHSAAALYATWAHEVIHSTGHSSRLARDLSGGMGEGGDGGRAYAREELVAELGAVLLGDRLEIGSAMANHAAYLGCPEAPAADGG
jgi:hypothetical protein